MSEEDKALAVAFGGGLLAAGMLVGMIAVAVKKRNPKCPEGSKLC